MGLTSLGLGAGNHKLNAPINGLPQDGGGGGCGQHQGNLTFYGF